MIDGFSEDRTVEIGLRFGAKVFAERGLPSQRMLGIMKSGGEFILLLDSDQVLEPAAIDKCVEKCEDGYDAIIIPERSVSEGLKNFSGLLADNMKIVQSDDDLMKGTALPRFFKRRIIRKIRRIPSDIGYFDHAFIYYEALRVGARVAFADSQIQHLELTTPLQVARKFFMYYGRCIIPAIANNKNLVISKVLPHRAYFSFASNISPSLRARLLGLYALKALATATGMADHVLRRIGQSSKDAMLSLHPFLQRSLETGKTSENNKP